MESLPVIPAWLVALFAVLVALIVDIVNGGYKKPMVWVSVGVGQLLCWWISLDVFAAAKLTSGASALGIILTGIMLAATASKVIHPLAQAAKGLSALALPTTVLVLAVGLIFTLSATAPASAQIADLKPPTITPAPMLLQAPAPTLQPLGNWFDRHEARLCAMKSADMLESIGTGLSLQLKEFAPGHSLWADLCIQFAEDRNSGFGGLSTEAEGLPIPLIEAILKPVGKLTLGVFDRWGVGTDGRGVSFYGVTDF